LHWLGNNIVGPGYDIEEGINNIQVSELVTEMGEMTAFNNG